MTIRKQRWSTWSWHACSGPCSGTDELLGRIQKRTGETREAIEKTIREAIGTCCV